MLEGSFFGLLPGVVKQVIRRCCYAPSGILDRLFHHHNGNGLVPPRSLVFVGGGDFQRIGQEFFRYLTELADLKPSERVLDIGCGLGRMAVPLTGYLCDEGAYEGFDIIGDGIDWCSRRISSRYPAFHFQVADLYNKEYNPLGRIKACDYHFPYPDNSFDLAIATSVFTHMLPQDVDHYLSEVSRVLRKGGRLLATFFLWNQDSQALLDAGKGMLDFPYNQGTYRTTNAGRPEAAVCYEESAIQELYERYGLHIRPRIYYGAWCGRFSYTSSQDMIVAWNKVSL